MELVDEEVTGLLRKLQTGRLIPPLIFTNHLVSFAMYGNENCKSQHDAPHIARLRVRRIESSPPLA